MGDGADSTEMFHILFDGSVTDRSGWVAMGGQSETLGTFLGEKYPKKMPDLGTALKLGHQALLSAEDRDLTAENMEVAVLDRTLSRRKFRRLSDTEVKKLL